MSKSPNVVRGRGYFRADTRFVPAVRPTVEQGYPQRIEIYDTIERLSSATRMELLNELIRIQHRGQNGKKPDERYVRLELRDMWNSRFIEVSDPGSGRVA